MDENIVNLKLGLSPRDRVKILVLYLAIAAATIAGFFGSWVIGRSYVLLAGLGVVAYVFGLRHGVDADHIAAIDNATRKLIQEGKHPLTAGTWFSLGHSTVVVGLVLLLVFATRAVVAAEPTLQGFGSILGTTVSGVFLWLIGIINVVIAVEVYRIFQDLGAGRLNEAQLEDVLKGRGFMNRYFGGLFKLVREPWQLYPIGLLFGLGFDTASEVALIAISIGIGVSQSVSMWSILILPLMFTCGMVLVDSSDGIAMNLAYGWAFLKPVRKVYYNLTITVISVLVAFLIGSVELLQVLAGELNLTGGFWSWVGGLDFETLGFGIVGLFFLSWIAAIAVYRYKRFDDGFVTTVR
jgi:high-affinity nickel-transport protein